MKNNSISHSQRQRKIWFEITKRNAIIEQEKTKNCNASSVPPKCKEETDEELVVSER